MLVAMLAASWLIVPSSAAMRTWLSKVDDACTVGGGACGVGAPKYAGDILEDVGGRRCIEGALECAGDMPAGVGGG
ncbi:hypothetical protein CDL15_Pgr026995 [Punica granatum]|uniref:Uncharacterized protein n=1 Tax=Punica granatum TaxID=22663 RepID=A0A218W8E0_PUNGR|nr:hypothetical protein CDL15_Pgr026995 [Punica granatum]